MKNIIAILLICILLLTGCAQTQVKKVEQEQPAETKKINRITMEFSNLPKLENGARYEAWLLTTLEMRKLAEFKEGGKIEVETANKVKNKDSIVVTIEAANDADELPSETVILTGEVEENKAALVFPVDFSSTTATYVLGTPTDGEKNNDQSGVWFMKVRKPDAPLPLELPTLPTGWKYEGWVTMQGKILTTGRFSQTVGLDESDPYSGTVPLPDFMLVPAEDYVQNAPVGFVFPPDLTDGKCTVAIAVEPDHSGTDPTGDTPFVLVFTATIPKGAVSHENYELRLQREMVPKGMVTVS